MRLKLQRIRPHQTRFVDSDKRFMFNSGGAGSGKTFGNIFKIFQLAFKHPGIMIGFGAENMPFLRRTIMRELDAMVPESSWKDVNKRDNIYTFPNNSKVQFLALYSEAVLKSFTCGAFGFEEITEIRDELIFNRVITVLRQPGMPGSVFGATNPGPFTHWFYKRFIEKCPDNAEVLFSRSSDNVFLGEHVIEELERLRETNPDYYRRMVLGEWGALEGLIYSILEKMIVDRIPEEITRDRDGLPIFDKTIAGVDFGWDHPAAVSVWGYRKAPTLISSKDAYFGVDELYQRKLETPDLILRCKELRDKWTISKFYCDGSRPEIIKEMRKAGLNAVSAVKKVFDGIMTVRGLQGSGRYIVHREASPFKIRELNSYVWDQDALNKLGVERPVKSTDDVMDADRYALHTDTLHGGRSFVKIGAKGASDQYKKGRDLGRRKGLRAAMQRAKMKRMIRGLYRTDN